MTDPSLARMGEITCQAWELALRARGRDGAGPPGHVLDASGDCPQGRRQRDPVASHAHAGHRAGQHSHVLLSMGQLSWQKPTDGPGCAGQQLFTKYLAVSR